MVNKKSKTKIKSRKKSKIKQTNIKSRKKSKRKSTTRSSLTVSQQKTLQMIKKDVKKELKKLGVKMFVETNKQIDGMYIADIPWDNVARKLKIDFISDAPFPVMIVVIKKNKKQIVLDHGGVYIQHSGITHSTKKTVIKLLKDMFGKKYKWNGSQGNEIFIKL